MTKQEFEARQLIGNWLAKEKIKPLQKLSHVTPRAYVIGKVAPGCLIVTVPWMDSEKQVRDFNRENPLKSVHCFDKNLKAGDWCAYAYVVAEGSGQPVAVKWGSK